MLCTLSLLVTVLTTVQAFFDFKGNAEAHKHVSDGFSETASTIRQELLKTRHKRRPVESFIEQVDHKYQSLIKAPQIVPEHIREQFRERIMQFVLQTQHCSLPVTAAPAQASNGIFHKVKSLNESSGSAFNKTDLQVPVGIEPQARDQDEGGSSFGPMHNYATPPTVSGHRSVVGPPPDMRPRIQQEISRGMET